MATDAQRKANARYDAMNTKQFKLKLNIMTDSDIIAYLATIGNKQGHLKILIRTDMLERELAYRGARADYVSRARARVHARTKKESET